MSQHVCSQCGHIEAIFGHDGGQKMAEVCGVPLLGQLPLDISIREAGDAGTPIVMTAPDGAIAKVYLEIIKNSVIARNEMTKQPQSVG